MFSNISNSCLSLLLAPEERRFAAEWSWCGWWAAQGTWLTLILRKGFSLSQVPRYCPIALTCGSYRWFLKMTRPPAIAFILEGSWLFVLTWTMYFKDIAREGTKQVLFTCLVKVSSFHVCVNLAHWWHIPACYLSVLLWSLDIRADYINAYRDFISCSDHASFQNSELTVEQLEIRVWAELADEQPR